MIRFVPEQDFHESATLTFILWEMTPSDYSGKMGVDTDSRAGLHLAMTTATVVVEPVNDSPVLSSDGVLFSINEDLPNRNNIGDYVSDIVSLSYSDFDILHTAKIHGNFL